MVAADERLCWETRRHCVVLARPLGGAVLLGLVGGVGSTQGWPLDVAGAAGLALAALMALRAVWRWDRTKVVVTTEKLSVVHGVLRRHAAAVSLASVGAVELEQTLLGRVLGYGTLAAGPLEITRIPAPREVCSLVEHLSAAA